MSPLWTNLVEVTQKTYSIYLRDLEMIGTQPAKSVTREGLLDIRDAIASKRGKGAADNFMRVAGRVFSWAIDRGKLQVSPAARGRRDLTGGTLPTWTKKEADLALKHLPEHLRRVVVLGSHIGQRRGDLMTMSWSHYDGQKFTFRQSKTKKDETKKDMVILASDALRVELAEWRRGSKSDLILTDQNGLPWMRNNLSMAMSRKLAAIDGIRPGLNVHGLRKLLATTLANGGATVHEIAAVTGHKTLSMVALYTQAADQENLATAAIERLQRQNYKRTKRPITR